MCQQSWHNHNHRHIRGWDTLFTPAQYNESNTLADIQTLTAIQVDIHERHTLLLSSPAQQPNHNWPPETRILPLVLKRTGFRWRWTILFSDTVLTRLLFTRIIKVVAVDKKNPRLLWSSANVCGKHRIFGLFSRLATANCDGARETARRERMRTIRSTAHSSFCSMCVA